MSEQEPLRIVLTPEQRAQIERASGEKVDAIELTKDGTAGAEKKAAPQLRWRLSTASGIPRQAWMDDDGPADTPATDRPSE